MKDLLQKAKSDLLDALRKAENEAQPRAVVRKLEKIIGDLETLQHKIN